MQRLSTPDIAPPPVSASAPLPPPPSAPPPPMRPIGRPLPTRRHRRRMPDEVRNSVVRAVLVFAFTLLGGITVYLSLYAGSWFSAPALLYTLIMVVVSVWAVLEIFVARQIHAEHLARGERCPYDP
jgi:hypothetical protein